MHHHLEAVSFLKRPASCHELRADSGVVEGADVCAVVGGMPRRRAVSKVVDIASFARVDVHFTLVSAGIMTGRDNFPLEVDSGVNFPFPQQLFICYYHHLALWLLCSLFIGFAFGFLLFLLDVMVVDTPGEAVWLG